MFVLNTLDDKIKKCFKLELQAHVKRSEIRFETSNASVTCNPGYPRAWEVPGTTGFTVILSGSCVVLV